MLVVIVKNGEKLYRTVTRNNIRKVAKSIHAYFPESNYPILEAIIFNGIQKGLERLEL